MSSEHTSRRPASALVFLAIGLSAVAACSSPRIVPPADGGAGGGGMAGGGGAVAGGGGAAAGGGGAAAGGGGAAAGGGGAADGGGSVHPTGEGDLIITEIMVDSDVTTDNFGEWFEIYNPSPTEAVLLGGCELTDLGNEHLVVAGTMVPPQTHFTLARSSDPDEAGFSPDYPYGDSVKLANEGDVLTIRCGGAIVDQVDFRGYSVTKGASMSLDPASRDATANDDLGNWCDGVDVYHQQGSEIDRATPGDPNPDC